MPTPVPSGTAALGKTSDVLSDQTVIGLLKKIISKMMTPVAVTGTVSVTSSTLPSGAATEATLMLIDAELASARHAVEERRKSDAEYESRSPYERR